MIEFVETFREDGSAFVRMKANGLPTTRDATDYTYRIIIAPDGWCESRSRAHGAGSTRYRVFRTYAEAQAHGIKWAKRKIAEAKKARETA